VGADMTLGGAGMGSVSSAADIVQLSVAATELPGRETGL